MTEIRRLKSSEWTDAMALTWRTFLKFDAGEYTPEGVKNFYKFITNENLEKMFLIGEYKAFGAFVDGEIIGILGLRNRTHISLLFVDGQWHRKGIATSLVECLKDFMKFHEGSGKLTVCASPYAVGFYHQVGFTDDGPEQIANGIRFTPMHLEF